ncbi:hypothetical protein VE03_02352 [Pseudogymnoascus sp. 23342-1-I1]|nr:hypothetical protein VE03_02352 [Pseudogymnoascus sp. 23342-1-I1]
MSDPFSVTGSVAGAISLGAATSKLVYQFVSSIRDAPREVQAITRSLYSVNIALCQIQTLLLDLTYASETTAEDISDLEKSVLSCVESFKLIKSWLRDVCSDVTEDRLMTRRAWQQVKYVFQKDSLKEALERLENEKGALQLIMSALNSKSMAHMLKVVRNAERAVQRNTQVIKRLELRITREIQDAIGRSHTTTSSISLDSICTQDEIERLLTDSGSALTLTLSDVSDDAASVILIPDTLSRVESYSVRIKFPTAEDDAEIVKRGQERESFFNSLSWPPLTISGLPISATLVRDDEGFSMARNIMDSIKTIRLTEKKATKGSLRLAFEFAFPPERMASQALFPSVLCPTYLAIGWYNTDVKETV